MTFEAHELDAEWCQAVMDGEDWAVSMEHKYQRAVEIAESYLAELRDGARMRLVEKQRKGMKARNQCTVKQCDYVLPDNATDIGRVHYAIMTHLATRHGLTDDQVKGHEFYISHVIDTVRNSEPTSDPQDYYTGE